MSAVRAYVMWRIKPGVEIKHDDLTYFSPGGYTFTHKSGKHVSFDFEEYSGGYEEEDRMVEFDHKEIDNSFITEGLKYDGDVELVQEEYDIEFFRDGKIDFTIPEGKEYPTDEMHVCMDLRINGEIEDEVDDSLYVEPVYMAVFDPYNSEQCIELYNKLTPEEYKEYIER